MMKLVLTILLAAVAAINVTIAAAVAVGVMRDKWRRNEKLKRPKKEVTPLR